MARHRLFDRNCGSALLLMGRSRHMDSGIRVLFSGLTSLRTDFAAPDLALPVHTSDAFFCSWFSGRTAGKT
jgi:hypothetical protein